MIVADAEGLFDVGFGAMERVKAKAAAPTPEDAASTAAEAVAVAAPTGIFSKVKALAANPLYLVGGLVGAYFVWTKVLKKKVPFIGRSRRR